MKKTFPMTADYNTVPQGTYLPIGTRVEIVNHNMMWGEKATVVAHDDCGYHHNVIMFDNFNNSEAIYNDNLLKVI